MKDSYKICSRCVMDTSDLKIEFNEEGVCSKCISYDKKISERIPKGTERKEKLNAIIQKIKEKGFKNKYDCIVGISGGVDSSYTLYMAKKLGLRPLAVHLDNGWNSKTATKNIMKLLKSLDIDLHTYVIDWEEFRDFQLAYMKASVIDIEALTDHAIKAILYKTANEKKIKYIITGTNVKTEGIMGTGWGHNKSDYINILDIHKKFGSKKLKTFPILRLFERINYQIVKNIQTIEILNLIPYKKTEALNFLIKKFNWTDYGKKHGESSFTKFYQNYILPTKFGVDKRKAHLSALINAGEITRNEALKELNKPIYDEDELRTDKEYVIRKLELSEKEFENIMNLPIKSHYDYKSKDKILRNLRGIYKSLLGR